MSRRPLTTLGLLVLISLTQLAFAPLSQETEEPATSLTLSFWVILFVIVVILALLLIWALRGSRRSMVTLEGTHTTHHEPVEEELVDEEAAAAVVQEPASEAEAEQAEAVEAKAEPAKTEPTEAIEAKVEPAAVVEAKAEPTEAIEEPTVDAKAEPAAVVEEPASEAEVEPAAVVEEAAEEVAAAPAEPDDLQRIEGIGPKLSQALNSIGITTFAQLTTQEPVALEAELRTTGVRFIKGQAQTWPVQAELAAAGKWDELDKLQDEFKGGRRRK